jgi:hypothetical protein
MIMIKTQFEKILGFEVEATGNPEFGDYTSNVAMTTFANFQFSITNFQSKFQIQNSNSKNP